MKPVHSFSRIASARARVGIAVVAGFALQAAIVFPFEGWAESNPGVATSFGILVAVSAAIVGGMWAGALVALVGWALFALFVADEALLAAAALPAWLAGPAVAGFVSDRLARVGRERRATSAELAALRQSSSEAVIGVGSDGAVTSWNPGAEQLYGYSAEEMIGTPVSVLVPEDESNELRDILDRARREEPSERRRLTSRRRDGTDVIVSIAASPVEDPHGNVASVFLLVLDASETATLGRLAEEAEWRHRALVEALPLVTYVRSHGDSGSLQYVSPQIERVLGYPREEWLADPELFVRLLHPEDRAGVLERLGATVETGRPFRCEYRMLSRGGQLVWLRDEATTVRDRTGEPLYVQGYLVDVSEQRRVEEERERLRAGTRAAIAESTDRQRRLDFVTEAGEILESSVDSSAALRRLAELVVREFAEWCVVDVVDDGTLRRVVAAHGKVASERESTRLPSPAPHPEPVVLAVVDSRRPEVAPPIGGSEDWDASAEQFRGASFVCVPMLARERCLGALTFVSPAARRYGADDVLLAQELARRSAAALESDRLRREVEQRADVAHALAHLAIAVFLVDQTGLVRVWNAAAEAILGRDSASVVGRPIAAAIADWQRIKSRIPISPAPPLGEVGTLPVETDTGQRWIAVAGVEFFGGTVYAFRDVTDERRVDELKAEFVATASHELRTPLAAVYGAAQTLRRHDFALDEAGRERFVSLIVDESERLGRIVNEILLANQLDAGRLDLASEPFDAAELIDRIVESARSKLPPGIRVEAAETRAPAVVADRDKVRQVLVNLVENAIKYSPDGGRIEVGAAPGDGAVRFHVRDEGLGIPADEQQRIFEKFYRLDPNMTRGVGGTGLGLYICSELVERMGGRIWVESKENEGSTFFFELPAAEPGLATGTGS